MKPQSKGAIAFMVVIGLCVILTWVSVSMGKVSAKSPWIVQSQKLIGVRKLIEAFKLKNNGNIPLSILEVVNEAKNERDFDNCFFNDPTNNIDYFWVYVPRNRSGSNDYMVIAPRVGGPYNTQDKYRLTMLTNGVIDWVEDEKLSIVFHRLNKK